MSFWKKMMNWIGEHASFESSPPQWSSSAGDNVMSKVWNDWTGNTQIDKSLQAQSAENEKIREYNLSLAKLQNKWNLEQWNRENAYNSPSAQKARLKAAGLNPDMMYGGGVLNTASASPQMTSGAPAESVDWSSLANKKTVGQSIMEGLAIEQARANIRKTNAEADIHGSDAEYRDRMNSLGLDKLQADIDLVKELAELHNSTRNGIDLDNTEKDWRKDLREKFGDSYVEDAVKKMAAQRGIAENELKFEIDTLAQRIVGTNAENTPLVNISNLSNQNVKLLIDVLKFLLK